MPSVQNSLLWHLDDGGGDDMESDQQAKADSGGLITCVTVEAADAL